MVEQYFGSFTQSQVILFDSAVFHRRQEQGSRQYTVDEKYIYRCHNGLWSVQKYSCIPHSNGKLGDVLKAIDAVMRECYGYGRPIQYKLETKWIIKIIQEEARNLLAEKKAAGQMGVGSHPRTRPDFLEAEAVSRLLRIAQAVDIPVVIVHLTNEAALREVEAARKRGQRVYVETCPQYLVLEDSVYDAPEYSMAARYVCAPPIRKERDQQALWTALRKGEIQTVSTDHCSFTLEQKDAGRGDFTKIPGGLPGVENRGELLYTYGVTTRKISLATMCRVLSENPAKLYGMFPRKGVLQDGADADIVVYDPQADHVLRAEDMASLAGYSPYEGFAIRGGIHQVWLRGRLAVEDGFVLAGPDGKYIPRGKCSL